MGLLSEYSARCVSSRACRVVLDEAQCIKNRATLAAHAAWSLKARRRWCLSGTPMQNSVDDLYSYFRFLVRGPRPLAHWLARSLMRLAGLPWPLAGSPLLPFLRLCCSARQGTRVSWAGGARAEGQWPARLPSSLSRESGPAPLHRPCCTAAAAVAQPRAALAVIGRE